MNLFLLLTAMLCGLTGTSRAIDAPVSAVSASRMVAIARTVAPARSLRPASRPDGYVAPMPLTLNLAAARAIVRAITPERRRE